MNEQERNVYRAPTIVLEMELETRAGSSVSFELDDYFDGEE